MRGANLCRADLEGADLTCADLRDANLQGANLHGADLRSANLTGSNLRDADHGPRADKQTVFTRQDFEDLPVGTIADTKYAPHPKTLENQRRWLVYTDGSDRISGKYSATDVAMSNERMAQVLWTPEVQA